MPISRPVPGDMLSLAGIGKNLQWLSACRRVQAVRREVPGCRLTGLDGCRAPDLPV
jgi:hypothetical protein